jgi:hypothetical protein
MATVASLFVPMGSNGPHHFKSIAVIDSSKQTYASGNLWTTVYKTTYDMNSVRDHTLYTSAAEIFKTPSFYAGVTILTLIVVFFLWLPLLFSFEYFMFAPEDWHKPGGSGLEGYALRLAILVALSCGLLIELFVARMGVHFAISSMKDALVKRERGAHTRWRIKDDDKWDEFVASLKRF